MGLFHSATLTILQHERDVREGAAKPLLPGQMPVGGNMSAEDWVTAVVRGADERSLRWKHILVLGGLLLGSGAEWDCRIPTSLEAKLRDALVQVTNLALVDVRDGDELGAHCIALVLNHIFPLLSEAERTQVDYDVSLHNLVEYVYLLAKCSSASIASINRSCLLQQRRLPVGLLSRRCGPGRCGRAWP